MGTLFLLYVDKYSVRQRLVHCGSIDNNDIAAFKNRIYKDGRHIF